MTQAAVLLKALPAGVGLARPGRWLWVTGVAREGYSETFAAATVWTCNHNLGRYPASARVRTLGGAEVEVETQHVSANQTRFYFDVPTAGIVEIY